MSCLLGVAIGSEEETVHDSTPAPEAGLDFGVYEIDRREDGSLYELGRGAMGITYRATDTSLQRKVALKIIKTEIAERSADARERFMREARAAAALRHENIATVYQFGMRLETGQYFYAMELIEGETLGERVHRAGPLDARTIVGIAQQVASALAAAEKRGLIHRDLKPENLMLLSADDDEVIAMSRRAVPTVKIIDFGLAKTIHGQTDPKSLTHDRFVGTPAFASPEQFEHSALDVRSDIYSLGQTLWFALTGRTPFSGRTMEEIHRAQKSNALPLEQLKTAHVPSRLMSLLESMLAFAPAARPGIHYLAAQLRLYQHQDKRVRVPKKSIAVLPFENLSVDLENSFFADGVHAEILTHLAKIAGLKVISLTSVMTYERGVKRNLREIAKELGVAHLLQGSVQRASDQVRVNVQLIKARDDAHLWAQTYDRDLADVFAIQSAIAKAIADQLQAKLSPNEKKAIEQPPTTDLAAFDLYSHAKSLLLTAFLSATSDSDLRKAIELLDEAVKRDPSFFDAYCQLAYAHEILYAVKGDHTPARLALAEAAVQAATRLRPDAAETHLARAQYLYTGLRDYAGALAELEIARQALPNDPRLFELTGDILLRRGQQEEGLRNLQRAAELDPRNFNTLQHIAGSYLTLGRYAESIAAFDRALSILPDSIETRATRGAVYLCWKADTRPLRQTIDAILAQGPSAIANAADIWFFCALAGRDPAAAERALVALGHNPCLGKATIILSHSFGEGLLARMTKDEARARSAFEAARAQQEKIVQAQPDYGPALCVLGLIDAALGRKDLALDEGRRAIALTPLEKDVNRGSYVLQYFAITAAWAGEKELALQQLEAGLRAPYVSQTTLSYGALKLFPFWDPLRGDPRFEKIVASLAPKER